MKRFSSGSETKVAKEVGGSVPAQELGDKVGEQLIVVKFEGKKSDGKVVVEEDKMLEEEEDKMLEEEEDKVLDEKLILQCFLDKIPGDTD